MTVTTVDKYASLVELLFRRTVDRSLTWQLSGDTDFYLANLAGIEITVGLSYGDDVDTPDVRININRPSGDLIDSFTDVTLADAQPKIDSYNTYYKLMLELHRIAGREATGAEKALDDLLSDLGVTPEPRTLRVRTRRPLSTDDEVPF